MDKLDLINKYHDLIGIELNKIPYFELKTKDIIGKAEDIAQRYFESDGFAVYRSRVKNGYRCIGAEFYWKEYKNKLHC